MPKLEPEPAEAPQAAAPEPPREIRWEPEYEEPEFEEPEYDSRPSAGSSRRPHRSRGRSSPPRRRRSKHSSLLPVVIGTGTLAVTGAVLIGVALTLANTSPETEQARATTPDSKSPGVPPGQPMPNPADNAEADLLFSRMFPASDSLGVNPDPAQAPAAGDIDALPRLRARWEHPQGGVHFYSSSFTSKGDLLGVVGRFRPEIGMFNPITGRPTSGIFTGHLRPGTIPGLLGRGTLGLTSLPGGEFLSIASDQNYALVWDSESLKVKKAIPCPAIPGPFMQSFVQATPDGRFFAFGGTPSSNAHPGKPPPAPVVVMGTETGKAVLAVKMDWGVARFTSDSKRLVVAHDRTGLIQVYRLEPGILFSQANLPVAGDEALALAISPDGRWVAYRTEQDGTKGSAVHICDVTVGKLVHTLPIPRPVDLRTEFSPDGKWLVVARRTGDRLGNIDLILVDTAAWAPRAIASLGRTWPIARDLNLIFSRDGSTLVAPQIYGGFTGLEVPRDPGAIAAAPGRPRPSAPFRILSRPSALVLAPDGSMIADGSKVVTARYSDNDFSQQWRAVPNGDGWYYLENLKSGTVLTVAQNGKDNGAEIVISQRETPPSEFQLWKTSQVPGKNGTIRFVSRASGKICGVDAKSRDAGARILLWDDVNDSSEWFGIIPVK
jgi:hypothetical protein